MTNQAAASNPHPDDHGGAGMVDPATLMKIRSMELRARAIVHGFWKVSIAAPFTASPLSSPNTANTPMATTRTIDWRLYARSDRFYVKKFQDETNLRCHLLIDHSRSMGYGSGRYTKAQYAGTLAATLAYFLFTQGDAVGLATFDNRIRQYMPPRNRPSYLRRLILALEAQPGGRATDLGPPLQRLAQMLTRRGLVVLISDLLTSIDRLERDLGYLAAGGHDVVLFHILDPTELDFNFNALALFQDIESENNIYIDPSTAQKGYRRLLDAHLAQAKSICQNRGVDYHLFATDRPFDLALLDFLQHRMRLRKQVRRMPGPGARGSRV